MLDRPRPPETRAVEILPQLSEKRLATGVRTVLVPVRVRNQGTVVLAPRGPARTELSFRLLDADQRPLPLAAPRTPLPAVLAPGQAALALVTVAVPPDPGTYRVVFDARALGDSLDQEAPATLQLVVDPGAQPEGAALDLPFLHELHRILAEADALKTLPDDYHDVTEGFLAGLKRRLKRKLLNNFRRGYVDVLSRQQSAFNDKALLALAQLSDCCVALGQARAGAESEAKMTELTRLLRRLLRRQRRLEQGIENLERRLQVLEGARPQDDER
jgi:hypothetical protein